MALTSAQQNKVVQLLGYGGKVLQPGSVIYDKILADRLASLPTDTEAQVVSYLALVASLETQISEAPARLAASKVDDLTLNLEELQMLRAERRRVAREISQHLDIPMVASGGRSASVRC